MKYIKSSEKSRIVFGLRRMQEVSSSEGYRKSAKKNVEWLESSGEYRKIAQKNAGRLKNSEEHTIYEGLRRM